MFMVVISTLQWETFKYKGKVPLGDLIVISVVSLVTVFANLATAVIVGILLSTVFFAWEKGKHLEIRHFINEKKEKVYKINGVLFFGSTQEFKNYFLPQEDPQRIILDLKYGKIMDSSAIEAINFVVEKYEKLNKKVLVTRATENCRQLLKNAESITSIKACDLYDPTYNTVTS
jgi:SulP family sulfate permease